MTINKLSLPVMSGVSAYAKSSGKKILNTQQLSTLGISQYSPRTSGNSHRLSQESTDILQYLNIGTVKQSTINKLKNITVPIEEEVLAALSETELKSLEKNWQLFQRVGKQKFNNISTDIIEEGTHIHNTMIHNLGSILDCGLMTGQSTIKSGIAGSMNYGNKTATPAALDTFIINSKQKIGTYFNPSNRNAYENSFIRGDVSKEQYRIGLTIDKSRVKEFEKVIPKFKGTDTHWIIPFGVPTSCIDRIIVSSKLPQKEVCSIIKMIEKRGLDIKLYNRDGKLLYDAHKL